MTAERPFRAGIRRFIASPLLLWCAFVVAHLVLGLINLVAYGFPLGDVTSVYKFWSDQAVVAGYWVGVDSSWVYPIVAIVPMLVPRLAYSVSAIVTGSPASADAGFYASAWLAMVTILDLIAFAVLLGWGRQTGWGRDRIAAGWWWTLFLVVLGPIALGRIDSVTVPIAVAAAVLVATRPTFATVLLTVAAWIKVWPGALVIALLVVSRERRRVLVAAATTSAVVVLAALAAGSGVNVFSFVMQQTGRGLQVEAPITTIWMWLAASEIGGTAVYYDQELLTWQVRGPGVDAVSALMTPLLIVAVSVVLLVGMTAVRRGAAAAAVLPPLVLALLSAMIAFQKVGSPQFMTWLAVPVIMGLIVPREARCAGFRVPAILVLLLGGLTHVMYPYLYGYLLSLYPPMLLVLTVRNILLFVLLAVAIRAVIRTPAPSSPAVTGRVTHRGRRGRVGYLRDDSVAGSEDVDARSILGRTQRRH